MEEQDEEERNMLQESMSGLQEQRKEMREFMETFNKTQEQKVNTMNALVGALTTFLENNLSIFHLVSGTDISAKP